MHKFISERFYCWNSMIIRIYSFIFLYKIYVTVKKPYFSSRKYKYFLFFISLRFFFFYVGDLRISDWFNTMNKWSMVLSIKNSSIFNRHFFRCLWIFQSAMQYHDVIVYLIGNITKGLIEQCSSWKLNTPYRSHEKSFWKY